MGRAVHADAEAPRLMAVWGGGDKPGGVLPRTGSGWRGAGAHFWAGRATSGPAVRPGGGAGEAQVGGAAAKSGQRGPGGQRGHCLVTLTRPPLPVTHQRPPPPRRTLRCGAGSGCRLTRPGQGLRRDDPASARRQTGHVQLPEPEKVCGRVQGAGAQRRADHPPQRR